MEGSLVHGSDLILYGYGGTSIFLPGATLATHQAPFVPDGQQSVDRGGRPHQGGVDPMDTCLRLRILRVVHV